jgi:hypothetical protein
VAGASPPGRFNLALALAAAGCGAACALLGGKPVGIVVDIALRRVALVDLEVLPRLPRAGAEWTPAETAPAVTYSTPTAPSADRREGRHPASCHGVHRGGPAPHRIG